VGSAVRAQLLSPGGRRIEFSLPTLQRSPTPKPASKQGNMGETPQARKRTASSTAISQKGFIDIFILASSTPPLFDAMRT